MSRRDALAADPVTARLAALLGTTVVRVDLLSGLAFAAVLEGVACLLWCVKLQPHQRAVATPVAHDPVDPVASDHEPVTPGHASVDATVPETDTEVTKLAKDIAAGHVRATVADIRRYLGCSQAKAIALRRQLAASAPSS